MPSKTNGITVEDARRMAISIGGLIGTQIANALTLAPSLVDELSVELLALAEADASVRAARDELTLEAVNAGVAVDRLGHADVVARYGSAAITLVDAHLRLRELIRVRDAAERALVSAFNSALTNPTVVSEVAHAAKQVCNNIEQLESLQASIEFASRGVDDLLNISPALKSACQGAGSRLVSGSFNNGAAVKRYAYISASLAEFAGGHTDA